MFSEALAKENVSKGGIQKIMKEFILYILKCNDDSYYVGHTDEIENRISEHMLGNIPCYTATRLPVELLFMQGFGSRAEAIDMERRIKKWSRKKKEALIEGDWNKVSVLAKKKFKKQK